jgi:hypothetical protein
MNAFVRVPCLVFAIVALVSARVPAQAPAADKLPPLSYVCPMPQDADVVEDKPGKCPKCGMTLVPVRLDSVWTCPVHAAVIKDKPGQCPIDNRDLVQVTMAVSWTCPKSADELTEPGTCADGSPRVKKYTARPHGNHNPQHGGLFFMAPDNWHHLEGTYARAGSFRMYLYDDFTKPLPRAELRKISGAVVLPDGKSVPLVPAQNGRYLEAKIGKVPVPAEMFAKVKFKPDAPESRFDFAFATYSKEPVAGAVTTTAAATNSSNPSTSTTLPGPAAPPASIANAAAASPAASASIAPAPTGADPAFLPLAMPNTVPEMLSQLSQRTEVIKRLIDSGMFASVYVPAFQVKDLALALDEKKNDLPSDRQQVVGPAVKRLVRSAWLLDAFGDLGNKEQITEAYAQFTAAVKELENAFPTKP